MKSGKTIPSASSLQVKDVCIGIQKSTASELKIMLTEGDPVTEPKFPFLLSEALTPVLEQVVKKILDGSGGVVPIDQTSFIAITSQKYIPSARVALADGSIVTLPSDGTMNSVEAILGTCGSNARILGDGPTTERHCHLVKWKIENHERGIATAKAALRELRKGNAPHWMTSGLEVEGYRIEDLGNGNYRPRPGSTLTHPEAIDGELEEATKTSNNFKEFVKMLCHLLEEVNDTYASPKDDDYIHFSSCLEPEVPKEYLRLSHNFYIHLFGNLLVQEFDENKLDQSQRKLFEALKNKYGYKSISAMVKDMRFAIWPVNALHTHLMPLPIHPEDSPLTDINADAATILYNLHYSNLWEFFYWLTANSNQMLGEKITGKDARGTARNLFQTAEGGKPYQNFLELVSEANQSLQDGKIHSFDRVNAGGQHGTARARGTSIGTVENTNTHMHPHPGIIAAVVAMQRILGVIALEKYSGEDQDLRTDKNAWLLSPIATEDPRRKTMRIQFDQNGWKTDEIQERVRVALSLILDIGRKYPALKAEALCAACYLGGAAFGNTLSLEEYFDPEKGAQGILTDIKNNALYSEIFKKQGKGTYELAKNSVTNQLIAPPHLTRILQIEGFNLNGYET